MRCRCCGEVFCKLEEVIRGDVGQAGGAVKKAKPRKPCDIDLAVWSEMYESVEFPCAISTAAEARRLADYLRRFADWAESREKTK